MNMNVKGIWQDGKYTIPRGNFSDLFGYTVERDAEGNVIVRDGVSSQVTLTKTQALGLAAAIRKLALNKA